MHDARFNRKLAKRKADGLMSKATKEQLFFSLYCKIMRQRKNWKASVLADLAGLPLELVEFLEMNLLYPEEFNKVLCQSIEDAFGLSYEQFQTCYPQVIAEIFQQEIEY